MNKTWYCFFLIAISCNSHHSNRNLTPTLTKNVSPIPDVVDSSLLQASDIQIGELSKSKISNLNSLGKTWGFLKYYHPAVAKGNFNWDLELFKILPKVLASSNKSFDEVMIQWIDSLGEIKVSNAIEPVADNEGSKMTPDFSWMADPTNKDKKLLEKFTYIFNNRGTGKKYYAGTYPNGNPDFSKEAPYTILTYPNQAFRLLALFRYWNIIQYYFPYKYLIGENWNDILPEFIPKFINAKDSTEYTFTCLELIGRIHDSHANIWGDNNLVNDFYGKYFAPIKTAIIENELVVTGYYLDTMKIKEQLKPGDVIKKINGNTVKDLLLRNLKYLPASNFETQLDEAPLGVLTRGKTDSMSLEIVRNGKILDCTITCIYRNILFNRFFKNSASDTGFKIIAGNIGYIICNKYHNDQIEDIKTTFRNTNGMIIDLRCYPLESMGYSFAEYIKSKPSQFARFTQVDPNTPGLFVFKTVISSGYGGNDYYKKRVVVLVNTQTRSQAEFTTMSFQSDSNVTVMGSTTAGADGDRSIFYLPGGIQTAMSGIGIYYPNRAETQRKGIKIDKVVRPTITGILVGRDEVLDSAIAFINHS